MKNVILLLAVFTLFQACGPTLSPFTERLYEQNKWSENQLKQIQFYLSEDIQLTRAIGAQASEIISGEIKVINGRKVEQVVIPKGTPGVFLFSPKTNRFAVSFEEGSDQRYLMFGPNDRLGGRFVLLAKDWDRRVGKVTYDGKLYRLSSNGAYASLLVDLKKMNKVAVASRRAGGRKVN